MEYDEYMMRGTPGGRQARAGSLAGCVRRSSQICFPFELKGAPPAGVTSWMFGRLQTPGPPRSRSLITWPITGNSATNATAAGISRSLLRKSRSYLTVLVCGTALMWIRSRLFSWQMYSRISPPRMVKGPVRLGAQVIPVTTVHGLV